MKLLTGFEELSRLSSSSTGPVEVDDIPKREPPDPEEALAPRLHQYMNELYMLGFNMYLRGPGLVARFPPIFLLVLDEE